MKYKHFFDNLYYILDTNQFLDTYTVKQMLNVFRNYLSPLEFNKYYVQIKQLLDKNHKQLTIDDIEHKLTVNELEKELEILKSK